MPVLPSFVIGGGTCQGVLRLKLRLRYCGNAARRTPPFGVPALIGLDRGHVPCVRDLAVARVR